MSVKTAFVYPGQGSQYVGMGTDFLEDPEDAHWFGSVCEQVDFPLRELIFDGPAEELSRTRYTQPCVFIVNHLIHRRLVRGGGCEPGWFAGHSLGEYNALVGAGRVTFQDLLPVVLERGRAMDEAARAVDGTMAAILRYDSGELEEICGRVSQDPTIEGTVQIALYNSPDQLVVSGSRAAVEAVREEALEDGALKAVELDVSGPWHSEYMRSARDPLAEVLETVPWTAGKPVITNVSATPLGDRNSREDLLDQLTRPVRWIESIHHLLDQGVTRFIEVGPGDALSGMINRILKQSQHDADVHSTDTLEQTTSLLGKVPS